MNRAYRIKAVTESNSLGACTVASYYKFRSLTANKLLHYAVPIKGRGCFNSKATLVRTLFKLQIFAEPACSLLCEYLQLESCLGKFAPFNLQSSSDAHDSDGTDESRV